MFIDKQVWIKKIVLAILFLLFVFFAFRTLEARIFAIHFVDEDENIIAGHFMAKGEKLYSDIFSHKQPMPAVFSALINKVFKPNSLFMLIKRHREAVFFYSVFWWLVLFYRFGVAGFVFSVILELSKRFLLGDLFLAESLVVYPLAYVLGCLWKTVIGQSKSSSPEKYLFLLSLVLISFQLFTLIPLVLTVIFYLLWREKSKKRILLALFLIFLLLFLIFLPLVNYLDYLLNTRASITAHYFKDTVSKGFFRFFFLSFLRPVAVLTSYHRDDFGQFLLILSGLYLLTLIYLLFKKKEQRLFLLFAFFLLGITSLRSTIPDGILYQGFHDFPWFAAILFLTIVQIQMFLASFKTKKEKLISYVALFFTLLIFGYSGQFLIKDYWQKADQKTDFDIRFSWLLKIGGTIKTLSTQGDKLVVIPVEQLLYFTSGLPHQNRFLYTYEWIFWDENLRNEIGVDLESSPPAILYYDYSSVGDDAKALFNPIFTGYVQLKQDETTMPLLLRGDKLDTLEDWQIEGIKNFGFTIPGVESK